MDAKPEEFVTLKRRVEQPEDEGWLITFADMSVLLMCFFVLMFSLSTPDQAQLKKVATALRETGFTGDANPIEDPYDKVKHELSLQLGESGFDKFTAVSTTAEGIDVELSSTSFFAPGEAKFTAEGLPVMKMMAAQIMPLAKRDITIVVEGYTDDTLAPSDKYPTSWELSTARASNVVRFFIAQGFPAEKLQASGYGDTRPKAPNRDAAGNPIPANQELNRRVVVRLIKGDDSL